MGVHFPAVELDNTIWLSTLSKMSCFLWHSSKWACQFGCFPQYMSGFEVLARSLDINLTYVTMLQLHLTLNHYVKLQQLSSGRCYNFLSIHYSHRQIRKSGTAVSWTWGLCWIFEENVWIFKIPCWFFFSFGLFVLSIYLWLTCYLLDS